MKKRLFTAIIFILLSFSVLPASAAENIVVPSTISEDGVAPASEETVWCTRIHNGVLQKRLWSITYGKWLTEWEDVE